jgi:hypothetical protein
MRNFIFKSILAEKKIGHTFDVQKNFGRFRFGKNIFLVRP